MPGAWHMPRRLTPEGVDALYRAQRERDALGVRIHEWLAMGACVAGMGPTSVADFAALPLLICFLVRMTGQHPILEPLGRDRVFWCAMAWAAWAYLSMLWSPARALAPGTRTWLDDIQALHFVVLPLLLQPVLDRRAWLTMAIMTGLGLAQIMQLLHLIDVRTGMIGLPFDRDPTRVSGWWDPVVGGSMLTAGLGMWLAILIGARTTRGWIVGVIGASVTLLGVLMTGTRGAWIASFLLVPAVVGAGIWLARDRTQFIRRVGVLMVIGIVAGGIAWATVGASIRERVELAVSDVRGTIERKDYKSDTGLRIAMWEWAIAAGKTHPMVGLGSGGYQPWVRSQTKETARELGAPFNPARRVHAHAHSMYLHTFATLGLVGVGILLAMLATSVWSGLRTHAEAHATALAPAMGIVGLLLAGLFDSVTVNQQTSFLLFALIALCLQHRPSVMAEVRG